MSSAIINIDHINQNAMLTSKHLLNFDYHHLFGSVEKNNINL